MLPGSPWHRLSFVSSPMENGQANASERISRFSPSSPHRIDGKVLSTIGYEGSTAEEFVSSLKGNRVDCLLDVRANAVSRKQGFSKTKLCAALNGMQIRYVHLPEAGVPSRDRQAVRNDDDLGALLRNYEKRMASAPQDMERAVSVVQESERPVLMCFEADHARCHRGVLAEMISKKTGRRIEHLAAAGTSSRTV